MEEDQEQMDYAQSEFGYFSNPKFQKFHEDEYPQTYNNFVNF